MSAAKRKVTVSGWLSMKLEKGAILRHQFLGCSLRQSEVMLPNVRHVWGVANYS